MEVRRCSITGTTWNNHITNTAVWLLAKRGYSSVKRKEGVGTPAGK